MNIQSAYDKWSSTYDDDKNFTRDLDTIVMKKNFSHLKFNTILEIGCGTGKNTVLLSQIGKKVYALDFSKEMISIAKEKNKTDNVIFSLTDITKKWRTKDQTIDLINCNLVLEHIEDLNFIFSEAARSLV